MNHWDEKFDVEEYIYGTEPNAWIKSIFNKKGNMKVALLAEGEGRNAVYMAKLGHDVTAYDLSQVGIDKTGKLAQSEGVAVKTNLQDITESDALPKSEYDISINVFGHVLPEGKREMVRNLAECVKPGGYIVLELYSKRQIEFQTGGPKDIHMMFDAADLRRELEKYHVEVIELKEVIVRRSEGPMHQGKSAVIQGFLKKK
ncbi:class I SAM-dependent methyltransferase [Salinicoccus hispanicus]|uniref:Methyltransferase domain-containing protein n=1 Tax=Salinicoccus hispanicus TaxID=157225 RepID=A0A6N8U0R2_9STAP|nr:methyltransferase domain-containing protein [Salinicoccus hispanicus]MXQ51670.1 methyltransferase domain-containing protein [Salinicoccus hispanicus]